MACLRGFEPPTFGSGVPYFKLLDVWGKPYFQGRLACFPLSTFSQNLAGLRTFCDMAVTRGEVCCQVIPLLTRNEIGLIVYLIGYAIRGDRYHVEGGFSATPFRIHSLFEVWIRRGIHEGDRPPLQG